MDTCTERWLRAWWFISVILLLTRGKPAECKAINIMSTPSRQAGQVNAFVLLAANCEPPGQRPFVKFAFAHVGSLEELWNALSISAVHNIILSAPQVELPAANGMAIQQPPLLITHNLSMVGSPSIDSGSFLRLNFAKHMGEGGNGPCLSQMRMAEGEALSLEDLIMTGAHASGFPSSGALGPCSSASSLVPRQQAVNLSVGISHQTTQIPGIQTIAAELPQVGWSISNGVPYQKHCCGHRTVVVKNALPDGMDVPFRSVAVNNSILMWAQTIKVRCELIIGVTRGHLPYTCSISALNSSCNGPHAAASAAQQPEATIPPPASPKASPKSKPGTSKTQPCLISELIYGVIAGTALGMLSVAGIIMMTELQQRHVALHNMSSSSVPEALPCQTAAEIQPAQYGDSFCASSSRSYASDMDQIGGMASESDDDIIDDRDLYDAAKLDTSDTSDWIWVE